MLIDLCHIHHHHNCIEIDVYSNQLTKLEQQQLKHDTGESVWLATDALYLLLINSHLKLKPNSILFGQKTSSSQTNNKQNCHTIQTKQQIRRRRRRCSKCKNTHIYGFPQQH